MASGKKSASAFVAIDLPAVVMESVLRSQSRPQRIGQRKMANADGFAPEKLVKGVTAKNVRTQFTAHGRVRLRWGRRLPVKSAGQRRSVNVGRSMLTSSA
jgi:hypothetical protein